MGVSNIICTFVLNVINKYMSNNVKCCFCKSSVTYSLSGGAITDAFCNTCNKELLLTELRFVQDELPDKIEVTIQVDINSIIEEFKKWYQVELTKELVIEFIKDRQSAFCFDTFEREDLGYFIANKVCGKPWPMNGDSDEIKKEFYREFSNNMAKFNIK